MAIKLETEETMHGNIRKSYKRYMKIKYSPSQQTNEKKIRCNSNALSEIMNKTVFRGSKVGKKERETVNGYENHPNAIY